MFTEIKMFTDAQEIFLVLFSILFGVMLQSLPVGLWPLDRLRGYKYPEWIDPYTGVLEGGGWARDGRGHVVGYKWRILTSFVMFNILPIVYFYKMLNLLNNPSIRYNNLVDVVFLFWAALGVFGFYRLYYVLILITGARFKEDLRREIIMKRELSFDIWAHIFWVLFYSVPYWYFSYKFLGCL